MFSSAEYLSRYMQSINKISVEIQKVSISFSTFLFFTFLKNFFRVSGSIHVGVPILTRTGKKNLKSNMYDLTNKITISFYDADDGTVSTYNS